MKSSFSGFQQGTSKGGFFRNDLPPALAKSCEVQHTQAYPAAFDACLHNAKGNPVHKYAHGDGLKVSSEIWSTQSPCCCPAVCSSYSYLPLRPEKQLMSGACKGMESLLWFCWVGPRPRATPSNTRKRNRSTASES